ncbi:MAG TPA: DUF4331 family protein [Dehalococcoidia bacterium]|nr:DUF4331 family protein [Dehalococcoidia bacterium]
MRKKLFAMAAVAMAASALFATIASAADHRDSPINVSNPTADINDVYAFRSPTNPNNLVVAISVNPLIVPSDNATRGVFDSLVTYQIHVDGNGDLADDAMVNIRRAGNSLILEGLGAPIVAEITPPGAAQPVISSQGGVTVFAGLRDDPFFFDLAGFQAFLANPKVPAKGLRPAGGGDPVDAFAGTNILSIVVELPVTAVTGGANANSGVIKTWVSTSRSGRIDRMAIPAINTALIPSAQKDAFNKADPINDARDFQPAAINTIKTLRGVVDGLFGGAKQDGGPLGNLTAEQVGAALVPDVVTLDFSKPLQFPNGRRLQDDVIDAALGVVLNRGGAAGIGDGVAANDKPFLGAFPYLAAPHTSGGGGSTVSPPNTGDGGLMDSETSWTLSAGFLLVAATLAGGAVVATARGRSRQ